MKSNAVNSGIFSGILAESAFDFQAALRAKLDSTFAAKKLALAEGDGDRNVALEVEIAAKSFGGEPKGNVNGVIAIDFRNRQAALHYSDWLEEQPEVDYYEIEAEFKDLMASKKLDVSEINLDDIMDDAPFNFTVVVYLRAEFTQFTDDYDQDGDVDAGDEAIEVSAESVQEAYVSYTVKHKNGQELSHHDTLKAAKAGKTRAITGQRGYSADELSIHKNTVNGNDHKSELVEGYDVVEDLAQYSIEELESMLESEDLSEVSKALLGRYIKKASQHRVRLAGAERDLDDKDRNLQSAKHGADDETYNALNKAQDSMRKQRYKISDKSSQRADGISKAVARLTKESVEEFENLDESQIDEVQRKIRVNSRGVKSIKMKCPSGFKWDPSLEACMKITGAELSTMRKASRHAVITKKNEGQALKVRVKRRILKAFKFRQMMGMAV